MLTEQELHAQGYRIWKRFDNGTVAGIQARLFDAGVICWPLTAHGHDHEWMYERRQDAIAQLSAWNGEGQPRGWRRHVGRSFELKDVRGYPAIRCLLCGSISFHPTDIAECYCGRCHHFHDDPAIR